MKGAQQLIQLFFSSGRKLATGSNTDRRRCMQAALDASVYNTGVSHRARLNTLGGRRRVNASRRPTGNGSRLNRTIPTTPPWSRTARRHTWERRVDWCCLPDRRVANGNDAAAADTGRALSTDWQIAAVDFVPFITNDHSPWNGLIENF